MEDIKVLETEEQIKVFSDPYRLKILRCFEYFDGGATAKMIADKLGEVPSKVSYHIKKMEKVQILNLVYTKEINGIIAKYYEPAAGHFSIDDKFQSQVSSQVYKNQTIKLICDCYDQSKEVVMKSLSRKSEKKEKKEKKEGFFSMSETYLTPEEIKEIHNELDEIIKKYKSKNKENGKIPFHMFMAGIPIYEDEQDK